MKSLLVFHLQLFIALILAPTSASAREPLPLRVVPAAKIVTRPKTQASQLTQTKSQTPQTTPKAKNSLTLQNTQPIKPPHNKNVIGLSTRIFLTSLTSTVPKTGVTSFLASNFNLGIDFTYKHHFNKYIYPHILLSMDRIDMMPPVNKLLPESILWNSSVFLGTDILLDKWVIGVDFGIKDFFHLRSQSPIILVLDMVTTPMTEVAVSYRINLPRSDEMRLNLVGRMILPTQSNYYTIPMRMGWRSEVTFRRLISENLAHKITLTYQNQDQSSSFLAENRSDTGLSYLIYFAF